jgi:hypothetical protein
VFSQYGWTVISAAVRCGAEPAETVEAIEDGVTTQRGMLDWFSSVDTTGDDELPKEPILTDAEVEKAAMVILRARSHQSAGTYTPGPTASLLLTLVRPEVDWDDELRVLTGSMED